MNKKRNNLKIGVDIDGVLANQIFGVLPIIWKRYGINLNYENITEWSLPVKDTNISSIIEEALGDNNFILNMPLHLNARKSIDEIVKKHRIIVITSRQKTCNFATKKWLSENKIAHNEYINSCDQPKSAHNVDVLIDDYVGHIKDFLEDTNGYAFLFNQPWNKDRRALNNYANNGRLVFIKEWSQIPIEIEKLNHLF